MENNVWLGLKLIDTSLTTKYSYIEYIVWSWQNTMLQWKHSLNNKQFQFGINWKKISTVYSILEFSDK
jgi:predicted mannosyl-3-phosphoglycerate phosphatase (HAD superfamily)